MEKKNWQDFSVEIKKILNNSGILYSKSLNKLQKGIVKQDKLSKIKSLYLLDISRKSIKNEIEEYKSLLDQTTENESEKLLVEKEIDLLFEKEKEINSKAVDIIIEEKNIKNNCLIEIRPGAGGTEAGLFARDIYQMYYKFSISKKWKVEILENRADTLGNLSFISFLIKGKEAFRYLKNESGVHRVQRVPITENKGRIQTSVVSVVVLPEVNEVEVRIENKDIRVDTYRSGGAGGQHVNTTDSAIRITHLPTGITATSQDARSQHENKEKAFLILRSRLFEKFKSEQEGIIGNIRNTAIGTGERSEKIRTYNYPQNRITDHRIKFTLNKLNTIMEGELNDLCKQLLQELEYVEIKKKISKFEESLELEICKEKEN